MHVVLEILEARLLMRYPYMIYIVLRVCLPYCRYVSRVDFECRHPVRIGNESDGGWDICLSHPFLLVRPCLVYSFGSVQSVLSLGY